MPIPSNVPTDLAKYLQDLDDRISKLQKTAITQYKTKQITLYPPGAGKDQFDLTFDEIGFDPHFVVALPDSSAEIRSESRVVRIQSDKTFHPKCVTWIAFGN